MLLLGGVSLPQRVWAGGTPIVTVEQWERSQQKQQLLRARFDKLLQQARAQQRLMISWKKKVRMQQAKHGSQVVSKRPKRNIEMAASR
jgi:hypothetical protein